MKGCVKEQGKKFKSFTLELVVESPGEARLLWHCFNHLKLMKALRATYNFGDYSSSDVAEEICCANARYGIEQELEKIGLKV